MIGEKLQPCTIERPQDEGKPVRLLRFRDLNRTPALKAPAGVSGPGRQAAGPALLNVPGARYCADIDIFHATAQSPPRCRQRPMRRAAGPVGVKVLP